MAPSCCIADAVVPQPEVTTRRPTGCSATASSTPETGALGASLVGDAGFVGVSARATKKKYGNPASRATSPRASAACHLRDGAGPLRSQGRYDRPLALQPACAPASPTPNTSTPNSKATRSARFRQQANEGRLEAAPDVRGLGRRVRRAGSERDFEAIGEEAFVPRHPGHDPACSVSAKGSGNIQVELGARLDQIEAPIRPRADGASSGQEPVGGAMWDVNDAFRCGFEARPRATRADRRGAVRQRPARGDATFEVGNDALDDETANQCRNGRALPQRAIRSKGSRRTQRASGFHLSRRNRAARRPDDGAAGPPVDAGRCALPRHGRRDHSPTGARRTMPASSDVRVFGDHVRHEPGRGGNLPRIAPARVGGELTGTAKRGVRRSVQCVTPSRTTWPPARRRPRGTRWSTRISRSIATPAATAGRCSSTAATSRRKRARTPRSSRTSVAATGPRAGGRRARVLLSSRRRDVCWERARHDGGLFRYAD